MLLSYKIQPSLRFTPNVYWRYLLIGLGLFYTRMFNVSIYCIDLIVCAILSHMQTFVIKNDCLSFLKDLVLLKVRIHLKAELLFLPMDTRLPITLLERSPYLKIYIYIFSWLNSAHGDINYLNLNKSPSSGMCFPFTSIEPFMDDHTYCKSDFFCQRMYKYWMFMNWTIQNWSHFIQISFSGDSFFMLYMYSTVQKHRQTKGNCTPKLMFLDVNVLWKSFLYQAVTVYRSTWSTVIMGFHIKSLQYAANTVILIRVSHRSGVL